MTKTGWALTIVCLLIIVAAVILFILPAKTVAPTTNNPHATTTIPTTYARAEIKDTIVADIYNGATIASPLVLTGEARGPWYFEASFPVEILDAQGKSIAQVPAQAQKEWMTESFVPFKATITFPAQPSGSKGTLILHKDNPSGLPEHDRSLIIPIVFK
jgi:immunoglobulin-like protein involved in spore germination